MMYKIVAEALQKEGLDDTHPQDYLNFYCLGKREVSNDVSTTSQSNENSPQVVIFSSFSDKHIKLSTFDVLCWKINNYSLRFIS